MSICTQCGSQVRWVDGKHCLNPDGSDHWDLCSAMRWTHAKENGERFTEKRRGETIIGFVVDGRKFREHIAPAHAETGKRYAPLPCACDAPPWELCAGCEHQSAWMARAA